METRLRRLEDGSFQAVMRDRVAGLVAIFALQKDRSTHKAKIRDELDKLKLRASPGQ